MMLIYTGNGRHVNHVPMRDLNESDMARLIEGRVFESTEQAIEELTKAGIYSLPKKPKKQSMSLIEDETTVEDDS